MSRAEFSLGEAVVGLLENYGVDTVFGIPGVHNVEMYRALPRSNIRHILTRHEQGAGFMADGYARATGKPGVCFIITGPGLGNIITPMGQAYSDSVPMLVVASTLDVADAGRGRGRLHEMRDQRAAAATVTQHAATVHTARDAQDLIAEAFSRFASARPRPYYIGIPIDVMKSAAGDGWQARPLAAKPDANADAIAEAATLLSTAKSPVLLIGGGAQGAGDHISAIAEAIGATIFTTIAAKGAVADDHPLHAGASLPSPSVLEVVANADVVLAAGTEIAETDLWHQTFEFAGKLIRIDIDPDSLARPYPATLPILADAATALAELAGRMWEKKAAANRTAERIAALRAGLRDDDDDLRKVLRRVLDVIRAHLPADTVIASDMTQIAYAANEIFPMDKPGCWLHPAGFGTLGYALPAAIGAKAGVGDRPVVALAGDYGFQYTINELGTAAELRQPLPVLLWNNNALGQIRDDMVMKGIQPNAVTLKNPDFQALAKAYDCHATRPGDLKTLGAAITAALAADRPTLIEMTPQMVTG